MLTIGTDPEFVLIDKCNNPITAGNYAFFNSTQEYSKIGCDGCGGPVEIRTTPVYINNVKAMLDDINNTISKMGKFCKKKKFSLYAGAYRGGSSIGGHIHIGSRDLVYDRRCDPPSRQGNQTKLTHILDKYFTPISNFFICFDELRNRTNNFIIIKLGCLNSFSIYNSLIFIK